MSHLIRILLALTLMATVCPARGADQPVKKIEPLPQVGAAGAWAPLFDGKSLRGWKSTEFGGEGEVRVENGELILNTGAVLSGVNYTNPVPKMNYEIRLEAKRMDGSDFFCGLTFPVADSFATFIVGGWGGGIVGISSVDSMDASENETMKSMGFDSGRWYKIRVRVTSEKLEAWIDNEQLVDLVTKDRKISLRPGPIESSMPFGLAAYQTAAAYRNIEVRQLPEARRKKVVFIAGAKSHGPGEHEYEKGLRLLKDSLDKSPNILGVASEVYPNGWPADPSVLDSAATIVLYCDGSDRNEQAHPLLTGNRLEQLSKAMAKGVGLVAIHYTVFVPAEKAGNQFLNWLGGYFDYETGPAANKWFSKIETRDYQTGLSTPAHAISRGLRGVNLKEEFYFNMRLNSRDPGWKPIVHFGPARNGTENVVGWAIERSDGGRGFGYTGGHFHKNWHDVQIRKLMLNAIVWTAGIEVPEEGVISPAVDADR